ncbi:MAG: tRNA epoxyqueuosine(34) reductase QueG [Candidatus Kerfeldbacteria bacterium RIFOXYA2_FULL_38_24]|uniref:tRNA epoxyqueuosine(34) reductase QueG n=1 Tax=Candidatus Kerfeldbacteria bacterium RIFOXYB2_FULL_38_14 TaxID=1798547 RepID=A0A1G2BGG9_9BACT|nr:MAG: tRNA epoxyqueuosine(34) reductase QueG [Candidatus Kerfeldbacteria bacterium RIFOXYA2_FULL_38_24]OGY88313.1 MAG: tRNA epoxyqueuosine(34) reductase QueG [Candidatus Kerfeldbacteria bacterium RIFOXYB2_FULL_38_14]
MPVSPSKTFFHFKNWLQAGNQAQMHWLARPDAVDKRADLRKIMPNAQSVLVLGFRYTPPAIPQNLLNDPARGIIARYALYDDYHQILKQKLKLIVVSLKQSLGDFSDKIYVDTGPILERELAVYANLGFIGRHSNLIHRQLGSYLFLAEIITSVKKENFLFFEKKLTVSQNNACQLCHKCQTNCPTQAIVDNKIIDARKCISYLTIEHQGVIPSALRPLLKNRIYGCDLCQEVCPYNQTAQAQKAVVKNDFTQHPDLVAPLLESLLFFQEEEFKEKFKNSPILRAKREGLMRNVAVALGNWHHPRARILLKQILRKDPSLLVRTHAQWGLMRQY